MSALFLLPCRCGQKIGVAKRQAGQTVTCACGAALEVPTLAGISRLQRAPTETPHKPAPVGTWGVRQAISLVGALVLLAAIGLGIYLWQTWPVEAINEPPTLLEIEQYVASRPVGELWRQWQEYREMPLDGHRPKPDPLYPEELLRYRLWSGAAVVILLGGLGLLAATALLPRRAAPRGLSSVGGRPTSPGP